MNYDREFDITFEEVEARALESGAAVCNALGRPALIDLPIQIRCAINGSPHRRLCYGQILEVLETRYPGYKVGKQGWRFSVRHTLSARLDLVKVRRPPGYKGHGSWWVVKPLPEGAPLRKKSQRKKTGKSGSSKTGADSEGRSSPSSVRSSSTEATTYDGANASPAPYGDRRYQAALSFAEMIAALPSLSSAQSSASAYYASPPSPWTTPMQQHGAGWQLPTPNPAPHTWGTRSRSGSTSSASASSQGHSGRMPMAAEIPAYHASSGTYWAAPTPPIDSGRFVRNIDYAAGTWATRSRSGSGSSAASSNQGYWQSPPGQSAPELPAYHYTPRMLPAFAAPPQSYGYQVPAAIAMPHHVRRAGPEGLAHPVAPPSPVPQTSSSPSRRGVMRISDLVD